MRARQLLEFSVGPGGARKGDIYAAGTLSAAREVFEEVDQLDPYLLLWYGACFRLWVVREGTVTGSVDLLPYVRSADPAYDGAVRRLLTGTDAWLLDVFEDIDGVLTEHDWDMLAALPLLDRVFALRERGDAAAQAEERLIIAAAENGALPGEPVAGLWLDWEALTPGVPALDGPVLADEPVTVVLGPGVPRDPDSYLHAGFENELFAGANNLE